MKKKAFAAVAAVIVLTALSVTASASPGMLSPALDVLSGKLGMTKTGLVLSDVRFSKEDFVAAVGLEPASVTFTFLPPSTDGAIYLSSTPVSVNQTVSASNLDLLRFVPTGDVRETSFGFTTNRTYSLRCVIKLIGEVNRAPVAGDGALPVSLITTRRDVTCFGTLTGSDPDGDRVTFEITKYPKNGLVSILDARAGTFAYTPYSGVEGVDSLSYRVVDEYGNYSDVATVSVRTQKRETELVLADMEDHWGQNAALSAVGSKVMTVSKRNGSLYFMPDDVMTRQDFLVTVMRSLGAGELSPVKTVFADDAEISDEASGYIAAACRIGIVDGDGETGRAVFRPNDPITRAEAAVILNRIIGDRRAASLPDSEDRDAVPAWAVSDVSAMLSAGVISRAGERIDPLGTVTKAEAAQMIYNVKNLYLT